MWFRPKPQLVFLDSIRKSADDIRNRRTSLLSAMRMVRYFLLSPMTMQFEMHGSSVLNSF